MVQITNRNGKSVLIPDRAMLADAIRALPAGVRSDLGEVRRVLASEHGVDQTCPVTRSAFWCSLVRAVMCRTGVW
jgi:hypothetical protein